MVLRVGRPFYGKLKQGLFLVEPGFAYHGFEHPKIDLKVFDQMPRMNIPICVGKGGGHKGSVHYFILLAQVFCVRKSFSGRTVSESQPINFLAKLNLRMKFLNLPTSKRLCGKYLGLAITLPPQWPCC